MSKRYVEVRNTITEKIESGEWPIGYKIPKETELCEEFEVSRTTVRHALSYLVNDGKIRRIKGTGSFVSRPQLFEKTTLFIQSFAEELKSRNLSCISEVLEFRWIKATEESIISGLGVKHGEKVFKLRRLRYSAELKENGPITLTSSYFPKDVGEILEEYDFEKNSLYNILKMNKIIRTKAEKTISATHLCQRECRMLSADEKDIFFLVSTISKDISGRHIEYCESLYPTDRNVFKINVEFN